jgi:diguanylate cyclase (GGDEF)-like protein
MIKKLLSEIKSIVLYFLSALIVLYIVYFAISLLIILNSIKATQFEIISHEALISDLEKTIVSNKINSIVTDAFYLADSLSISNIKDGDYTNLKEQWKAFADRKKIYDEIRFINLEGDEVVQISYAESGAYSILEQNLENKADQLYFTNTINLKKGQVFVSEFSLNNENDQTEQPNKPIIRISTPYFIQNGEVGGIVILNYYASDLMESVKKVAQTSYGSIYIINSDGYWISNSKDSSKVWTFIYKDKMNQSFQSEFPYEWDIMKKEPNSYLCTSKGLFTWANVVSSKEFIIENSGNSILMHDDEWYVVTHLPTNSVEGKIFTLNFWEKIEYIIDNNIIFLIFILFFALIFGVQMTLYKIKKDKIKHFSEYDALTEVFNRRVAFERLNKLYKELMKVQGKLSVCFIDINGLKEVNDYLGHDSGNELILSIVECIKKNTRDTDLIARLGGDEFLIIFNNMSAEDAEKVWTRISAEFDRINEEQNRKYVISASHGIEEFNIDTNKSIDVVVNQADEKMYREKRRIKKDETKIIRD